MTSTRKTFPSKGAVDQTPCHHRPISGTASPTRRFATSVWRRSTSSTTRRSPGFAASLASEARSCPVASREPALVTSGASRSRSSAPVTSPCSLTRPTSVNSGRILRGSCVSRASRPCSRPGSSCSRPSQRLGQRLRSLHSSCPRPTWSRSTRDTAAAPPATPPSSGIPASWWGASWRRTSPLTSPCGCARCCSASASRWC